MQRQNVEVGEERETVKWWKEEEGLGRCWDGDEK